MLPPETRWGRATTLTSLSHGVTTFNFFFSACLEKIFGGPTIKQAWKKTTTKTEQLCSIETSSVRVQSSRSLVPVSEKASKYRRQRKKKKNCKRRTLVSHSNHTKGAIARSDPSSVLTRAASRSAPFSKKRPLRGATAHLRVGSDIFIFYS